MNNILLFMSLSGSVALILYYLFRALFGRYLSAAFRYLLLKLSMCFFLLPVPVLSGDIRVLIRKVIPDFYLDSKTWEKRIYDLDRIIYDTPHGYLWSGFSWVFIILFSSWLITVICILLIYRRNYRKLKMMTEQLSETDDQLSDTVQNLKSEIHIHKNISTCKLTTELPPFCYGFLKPRIAIPEGYDSEAEEMFLRHELHHIKSRDFITRMLGLLIIAVHFFNPLAYLLFYEIGRACELACDEKVISVYSEEQRKKYGCLLLDNVITSPLLTFGTPFSGNNKHSMKERISMIKQPKRPKHMIFIICALFSFLCSTLSVAAYELPRIEENSPSDPIEVPDWYMFSTESLFSDPNEQYFEHADCFFIDENGNVTFDTGHSASPQSICSHTYVSGYLYQHLSKPGGSCVYSVYSCKKCSKCGATKDKTLISTTTYTSCPHGSV